MRERERERESLVESKQKREHLLQYRFILKHTGEARERERERESRRERKKERKREREREQTRKREPITISLHSLSHRRSQ